MIAYRGIVLLERIAHLENGQSVGLPLQQHSISPRLFMLKGYDLQY